MGFLAPSPPKTKVEVVTSTHGNTFVTWPPSTQAADLPALPVGHHHPKSRQWLLANKTVVLVLPGDPAVHQGGVIRHTFDVVSSTWNSRSKILSTVVAHPSDPEVQFVITTNGTGCSCTQGPAGNAGPTGDPYEIDMVRTSSPEFDWYMAVTP